MSKTVLLIDDDEIDNFINKKVLENCGVTNVLTFTSPETTLQYLAKPTDIPQMILLDIYFPFMNCFEFLVEFEKLKVSRQPIDIFILSTVVNPGDRKKARQKFAGFIEKPLTKEKLLKQYKTKSTSK